MKLTKFKIMRLQRGFTQWEIGKRLNMRETEISKIENGKLIPSPALAFRIAKVLGTEPEFLFEDYKF